MDRQEPLRVALLIVLAEDAAAWRIDVLNIDIVEYVRRDASFDSPTALTKILMRHMGEAGCFAKSDALSSQHTLDQNYTGPFLKLAQAYEQRRLMFNPGALSLQEYLADRLQSAVAEICGWVRDCRLRASGAPVDVGREGRAREIRPSEMSAPMTIGADGDLYQGQNKKGPAWRAVYVSSTDFVRCQADANSTTTETKRVPSATLTVCEEIAVTPDHERHGPEPRVVTTAATDHTLSSVVASQARRRGRRPDKLLRAIQILKKVDRNELDGVQEKELVARFGSIAARTWLSKARREVLAANNDK